MMLRFRKNQYTLFNKVLILALTLIALLTDGVEASDCLFLISIILWLWMPLWSHVEKQLLKRWFSQNETA